jgi:hypothetical protein
MRCCGVPSTYWECPDEGGGNGGISKAVLDAFKKIWNYMAPYKTYIIIGLILLIVLRLAFRGRSVVVS